MTSWPQRGETRFFVEASPAQIRTWDRKGRKGGRGVGKGEPGRLDWRCKRREGLDRAGMLRLGREKPKGSPPQPPIKVGGSPSGVLFNLGSSTKRAWTVGNAATGMATHIATGIATHIATGMLHTWLQAWLQGLQYMIHTYVGCGRYIPANIICLVCAGWHHTAQRATASRYSIQ